MLCTAAMLLQGPSAFNGGILVGSMEVCANGVILHHSGVGPVVVSTVRHCNALWLVEAGKAVSESGLPAPGTAAYNAMAGSWIMHSTVDKAVDSLKMCGCYCCCYYYCYYCCYCCNCYSTVHAHVPNPSLRMIALGARVVVVVVAVVFVVLPAVAAAGST